MQRRFFPAPLASQQRLSFATQHQDIAKAVLSILDHQTKNAPEDGWAMPDKRDILFLLCEFLLNTGLSVAKWSILTILTVSPGNHSPGKKLPAKINVQIACGLKGLR